MLDRLERTLPPLLLSGMLTAFLLLYSYRFYQVNSYKLALALVGGGILALLTAWMGFRKKLNDRGKTAQLGFLLLLPTLAGLPGVFLKGAAYNFPYEVATDLVAFTWAMALVLLLRGAGDLQRALAGAGAAFLILTLGVAGQLTGFWNDRMPVFAREALSFGNPNFGAGVCLMFLALYAAIGLPRRPAAGRWEWPLWQRWFGLFTLAAFLVIIHTGSRAGLVLGAATLAGMVFLVAVRERWGLEWLRAKPRLAISTGLALCGALGMVLSLRWQDFANLASAAGWQGRLLPWKTAWDSFLAAPLLGHGLGSSYTLFFQFRPPDSRLYASSPSYNHVHNEHLQILQESGLTGYLLIILPLLLLVALLLRKWLRSPAGSPGGRLALGLAGGIALFYLHGLFSVAQRMILTNLPLYLMVAGGLTLLARHRFRSAPREPGRAASLTSAAAALLLAAVLLIPWLNRQAEYNHALALFRKAEPGEREKPFIEKLKDSKDIYALHHAALACTQITDHENGIEITERIEEIIPWYRNTRFMRAALFVVANRHGEAVDLLEEILRRDRYSKNALPARAAYAALDGDLETFSNDLRKAMKSAILLSPRYAGLGEEDASVVMDRPIAGLIEVEDGDGTVVLTVNPDWVRNLYTVFGRRGKLSLQDRDLTPMEYTRTLMAYSPYVQLPYREGLKPDQEENMYWYSRYTEYQNLRNHLRRTREQMRYLGGRNPDIGSGNEQLEKRVSGIEEELGEVQRDLRKVIDMRALEQRHQTFVNITEFVLQTETFSRTIALARQLQEQAEAEAAAKTEEG